MHKNLKDFWHFSRRYRQFQRVSSLTQGLLDQDHEVSEETRKELDRLNRDRITWHNKIAQLDLPSLADCGTCNGACCQKPSEHYFTAIDYWLRRYTPHELHGFALQRVRPLHDYYRIRIKKVWPRVAPATGKEGAPPPTDGTGCSHLGEAGCQLPHVERPLKCVIYACPGLKRSPSARKTG